MTALFKAAWLSGYKTLCVTHPQQDLSLSSLLLLSFLFFLFSNFSFLFSLDDFHDYCREMALLFTAKVKIYFLFSCLDGTC